MSFKVNPDKKKVDATYKTLYLSRNTLNKIEKIMKDTNTSFNGVINRMIQYCLENMDEESKDK